MKKKNIGSATRMTEKSNKRQTKLEQKIRALHSELLSEISSRVSSRNKFSRVETSSVTAQKTRSDHNFQKTPISETRENENFGKNRLSQGLTKNQK